MSIDTSDLKWLEDGLQEHADLAYRICYRITQNTNDAEDAYQDACLMLIRRAHTFQIGTSLRAWICAWMSRSSLKLLRAKRSRRRLAENAAIEGAAMRWTTDSESKTEQFLLVSKAMTELAEGDQLAIQLRYGEGLSDNEVATVLECKEDTAGKRIRRALDKLRKTLGEGIALALLLALLKDWPQGVAQKKISAELRNWTSKAFLGAVGGEISIVEENEKGRFKVSNITMIYAAVATFSLAGIVLLVTETQSAQTKGETSQVAEAPGKTVEPSTPDETLPVVAPTRDSAGSTDASAKKVTYFDSAVGEASRNSTDVSAKKVTPLSTAPVVAPPTAVNAQTVSGTILWTTTAWANGFPAKAKADAVSFGNKDTDTIVQATNGHICALDAHTGKKKWNQPGDFLAKSVAMVHDGVVYTLGKSENRKMSPEEAAAAMLQRALRRKQLPEADKFKGKLKPIKSPRETGSIVAYNLRDGSLVWEHPILDLKPGQIDSSFVYDPRNENILIGTRGGQLLALTKKGKRAWVTEVSGMDSESGGAVLSPSVAPKLNLAFTGIWFKSLVAIETDTGNVSWELAVDNISYVPPTYAANCVYVVTSGGLEKIGRVLCVEAKTGAILWEKKTGDTGVVGAPVVVAEYGLVVVQGDQHLIALDAKTGERKWRTPLERFAYTSCVLYKGFIFAGTDDGELLAVRASDGVVAWRQNINKIPEAKNKHQVVTQKWAGGKVTITTPVRGTIGDMGPPRIVGDILYATSDSGLTIAMRITIAKK